MFWRQILFALLILTTLSTAGLVFDHYLPPSAAAQIISGTAYRIRRGPSLPATCNVSDIFYRTSDNSCHVCGPVNTWTQLESGAGAGDVVGPASSTDNALARFDGITGKLLQNALITLGDTGALSFPDNIRQTFNPGTNVSGFNVGSNATDPDTPINGDIYYNSTTPAFRFRENDAWVTLANYAPVNATYITQTADAMLTNEQALSLLSSGIMRVATTTGVITSLTDSAGIAANISDETGSGALVFGTSPALGSPTITTPTISGAITLPDNVRQIFNPGANAAGVNVGAQAGDPDTPSNGDIWYDSTANELTARINGANVALGAGGGGTPGGANTQLQYNNAGAFGGITGATSNGTNVTFGSGNLLATAPAFTTTFTLTRDSIGATSTDGGILQNTIDAAAGAQQWSPRLRFHGEGWKTNATAASQEVDWAVEVRPVQGAANPSADLRFSSSINGGAFSEWGYFTSGGQLILSGTGTAALPTIQNVASVGNPTGINLPAGTIRFVTASTTQAIISGNTAIGLQLNSGLPLGWGSGTPDAVTPDTDIRRVAAKVVGAGDGASANTGWLTDAGIKRVSTQFDKTDTTLANVTGLSTTVQAGRSYSFIATLHISADATGGHKYAVGGTATATAIIYQINSINNATNAFRINARHVALGGSTGEALGTTYFTEIRGLITVNVGGTLTVQFAQNMANGTSSVLAGSDFVVRDNP